MNITKQHTEQVFKSPNGGFRGLYISPRIERITLDKEISLALESTPPYGPDEIVYNQNTPFKQKEVGLI